MVEVLFDETFKLLSANMLNRWLIMNKPKLVGSAIFSCNKSFISKLICKVERIKSKSKTFVPSHTGSVIEHKGELYVFDMKPPRAKKRLLIDFLLNSKDKFALVIRNFELDGRMFSLNIKEHIGEKYPYMSALRSAFTKRESKWRRHCSEMHLRELQKQGIYTELNPEITPEELYNAMLNSNNI